MCTKTKQAPDYSANGRGIEFLDAMIADATANAAAAVEASYDAALMPARKFMYGGDCKSAGMSRKR